MWNLFKTVKFVLYFSGLINIFIKVKHAFPDVWNLTEKVNSSLFSLLYKKLDQSTSKVLSNYSKDGFIYSKLDESDINDLIDFRKRQAESYLIYFDPHPFDRKTIHRLLGLKSYSLMKIKEKSSGKLVGYFFLRCFFIGKVFHGLITDSEYQNRGLGTSMWDISMQICHSMGLRMFATVSKHNAPSLKSASNATKIKIKEQLDNDYLLIECSRHKD